MASSLASGLFGGNAPASVRRPTFEAALGTASAAEWARATASIVVELGLAPFVDFALLRVSAADGAPAVALGDAGTVSLSYDDDQPHTILTGEIQKLGRMITGEVEVAVVNGSATLAALRLNQSYEQVSAGDIVRDLCGRAGVTPGSVEDGLDLPFYVIDDRSSTWRHIAALARKSGYVAYINADGELMFGPASSGDPVASFGFGVDVLEFRATESAPVIGKATVTGEGAAGKEGSDAWNWLVKDSAGVTDSSGSDDPERILADASLRSTDAVRNAAVASIARAGLAKSPARLLVPGSPAVIPGSAVEIQGAPQDALNGVYVVRWIRHSYSKQSGFVSLIQCAKSDTGPGGL